MPYSSICSEGEEEEVRDGVMVVEESPEPGQDQHKPNTQRQQDERTRPKLTLIVLPEKRRFHYHKISQEIAVEPPLVISQEGSCNTEYEISIFY